MRIAAAFVHQRAAHLQFIFEQPDEFDVSLYELSAITDIRPIVLKTLLTYLELEGYLQEGTPVYETYQFKALAPSKEILSHFEGERQQFLKDVFRQAKPGRIWFSIELQAAADALRQPRERIVKALRTLLPKKFPGATFSFLPADIVSQILNFGLPAAINVQFSGPQMEKNAAHSGLSPRLLRKLPLADA